MTGKLIDRMLKWANQTGTWPIYREDAPCNGNIALRGGNSHLL